MKIKSKPLYEYLIASDVLGKDTLALDKAKKKYRRLYKNKWAKQNRSATSEVRFQLSKDDFQKLQKIASQKGHNKVSTLVRDLIYDLNRMGRTNSTAEVKSALRDLSLLINKMYTQNIDPYLIKVLESIERPLESYFIDLPA